MSVSKDVARFAHDPWKNRRVMRREASDDLKSDKSSGVSSTSRSERPLSLVASPSENSFPSWATEDSRRLLAGDRSMINRRQ